ncbi:MAG: hypothetical protein H6708_13060 [Kofleriaceae bacterium]|nr:hypothetical protein [Kofleriaceae bacterium]
MAPSALVAIDGDAQRGEVEARWRLRGAAPGAGVIASGTRLELRGDAFAIRRAGFAVVTGELGLRGRLDLGRVAPALDGAFGEAGVGLGLEVTRYDAGDLDATELVTARFGLGLYLGCGQGEALLWYEHRRDDLAGGLAAWRAAGFIGRAGLTGAWSLTPRWAIAAEVQAGSAWVTTLAVRRRGGAR